MPPPASALRFGLWSSVVILVSGLGLLLGIVASALWLPAALTTGWAGMASYAEAYRSTGGTLTALPFLAALVSCPAYVIQVASLHGLDAGRPRIRRGLGLAFALAFASLAGLNYVVQLTVVRIDILSGQTQGLETLVFQNPDSLMLELDLLGWFFLGLAFLTTLPLFRGGGTNRLIRWCFLVNAFFGCLPFAGLVLRSPAIGEVSLVAMSAVLLCADVLLLFFFRKTDRTFVKRRSQV